MTEGAVARTWAVGTSGSVPGGREPPPWRRALPAGLLGVWMAATVRADCVTGAFPNPAAPFTTLQTVFPNWLRVPTASFTLEVCDDAVCGGPSPLVGITIMNYGSAVGGTDIADVYWLMECGTKTTLATMTYAGAWTVMGSPRPVWTWAGSVGYPQDPCSSCACNASLHVYTDITACPTDGRTIELGPGFNDIFLPAPPGGITDSFGCGSPWGETRDPVAKEIRYVLKTADRELVPPGDTVTYTVYYGRPGTAALTGITITDSLPPWTHYVAGSGVPAPDTGWDPDPGPPLRLRWSRPGGAVTGGETSEIRFSVSVDWGNGEAFEPGSGDAAAPEGAALANRASAAFEGIVACGPGVVSGAAGTTVQRYLFWQIGDNDVLFASRTGQPDDEIVYELFVRNTSSSRTWWNVRLWDTVPAELDPWGSGSGFEDPCVGWTMTPTGCAAASPGWNTGGGLTRLTWEINLPPLMTLSLRWRARVRPTAPANSTAVNGASIQALGQTGVVNGTGDSSWPSSFTHRAGIILRTMYISYIGWAGLDGGGTTCNTQTYYLSFYPLNKATDFALYRKWCCSALPCDVGCAGFAATGGVSPAIDVLAGTCTGGPITDWEMGCKVERIPARYMPSPFATGNPPAQPWNFLHKLLANSPLIWELSQCLDSGVQEAMTFTGFSTLTFVGRIGYSYLRLAADQDDWYIVNSDPATPTLLHLFRWDAATLSWSYVQTQPLAAESEWPFRIAAEGHHRILSSAADLVAMKMPLGNGDDKGAIAPSRETGNLTPAGAPATFYLFSDPASFQTVAIVGNIGAVKATYEVARYVPDSATAPPAWASANLRGSSGVWKTLGTHTVDPGLSAAANPHVYGNAYDTTMFTQPGFALYRVRLTSGGPVQVYSGWCVFCGFAGGSMLHASDPAGSPVGTEFWVHSTPGGWNCGTKTDPENMVVDIFCPKRMMVANATSSDGATSTYTTTDVDQCVAFRALTGPAGGTARNWRFQILPAGNQGDAIAQYILCQFGEKFYTAPFLRRGVFYSIAAPPLVYCTESFWITVVVTDSGGGTRTDYCGTTAFTSTDPVATIEGTAMDAYLFTWSSGFGCSALPNENGVKGFLLSGFSRVGAQSVAASDTADGSIVGLATFTVVCGDVKFTKEPRLVTAASGDTVRFRVCWSNYSSASAFSLTVNDAVPVGTTFVPEAAVAGLDCGNTDGLSLAVSYSTATSATMPPAASFLGGNPVAGTRWLRWAIPMAGVQTTGCGCFRVRIN